MDNPTLLGVAEDSDVESASEDQSASRPTKKRKAKTAGGRIPKGEDFWGQVDLFFKKGVAARGRNLAGSQWKECVSNFISDTVISHILRYVNKVIQEDNERFSEDTIERVTSQATLSTLTGAHGLISSDDAAVNPGSLVPGAGFLNYM